MGSLVRAAEACYDGAKAYRTPFVSGKDSLNNQFTIPGKDGAPDRTIEIPPTLLITGMGIVPSVDHCVTSDAKRPGNYLVFVGAHDSALGGSHYQKLFGTPKDGDPSMPRVDLERGPAIARTVHELIQSGLVHSAHDVSEGGMLVAIAEMLIAGSSIDAPIGFSGDGSLDELCAFAQPASCYIVEVSDPSALDSKLAQTQYRVLGKLDDSGNLDWDGLSISVEQLTSAWRGTLDWS
jgi:phosphoribosylformylglycinamidine synthase